MICEYCSFCLIQCPLNQVFSTLRSRPSDWLHHDVVCYHAQVPEPIGSLCMIVGLAPRIRILGGVRTRFEITVTPSILSQITVALSKFFMKLRIFVSVTWFNHQMSCKIYLNYHSTAQKLSNTKYRYIQQGGKMCGSAGAQLQGSWHFAKEAWPKPNLKRCLYISINYGL